MLIVKIISQILAFGLIILSSTLDYVYPDKGNRLFKKIRLFIFIAATLFLIVSIATTISDDIERKNEIVELKSELNRGLLRMQDFEIEFMLTVPFETNNLSDLSKYTARILPSLEKYQSSLAGTNQSSWIGVTIPYISESPLFPDLKTERLAYSFLSTVGFSIEIFSKRNEASDFVKEAGHYQGQGDIVLSVSRSAGKTKEGDVFLQVNHNKQEFVLFSPGAKTEKPRRNTGKILSIPDLAGATIIFYFYPNSEFADFEKLHNVSIATYRKLGIFGLMFSDGQKIYLKPEERINNYGEIVYVLNFPDTYEEIKKNIQR